jgi:hypothetical protein
MIGNDSVDSDEFYWMENEPNKEKNVLTKIYSPKTDRRARIRALRERVALEHLTGIYIYISKKSFCHFIFFDCRTFFCTKTAGQQCRCLRG